jgi:4-nitrophenyl phosphatase
MRTPEQNVKHMEDMGYTGLKADQYYNSAMAAAAYAKAHYKGNKAAYVGAEGMLQALKAEGFEITEDHPDFLFVGLNKQMDYAGYSKALSHLLAGAKLIGTNKDRVLAKPGGFEVGNGSIVAMFEYASGQPSPDIAKPAAPILDLCLEKYGLKREDVILVGDNLETDIALGYNNSVKTVLVESGVHKREDIGRLGVQPDCVVKDLAELEGMIADGWDLMKD